MRGDINRALLCGENSTFHLVKSAVDFEQDMVVISHFPCYYLRNVEKMCRGDFTFLSDTFLLCVQLDFSLLFFHCCVTNVCMILQIKKEKKIFLS